MSLHRAGPNFHALHNGVLAQIQRATYAHAVSARTRVVERAVKSEIGGAVQRAEQEMAQWPQLFLVHRAKNDLWSVL